MELREERAADALERKEDAEAKAFAKAEEAADKKAIADTKDDKELNGLIAEAEERKAIPNADGMTFIDWHNEACSLIRQRHNGALANKFDRARQDTGTLAQRFDASIKKLRRVVADGEMPKPADAPKVVPV